ncbi:hypothetical protein D3C77_411780 [compost metagenome]
MIALCLALCFSSLSALCLGTERHYQQVFEAKITPARHWLLRLSGWLLLASAIAPVAMELGPSVGLALWITLLGLAASAVVLLLSYTPRLIVPLALGTPPMMVLLMWL